MLPKGWIVDVITRKIFCPFGDAEARAAPLSFFTPIVAGHFQHLYLFLARANRSRILTPK